MTTPTTVQDIVDNVTSMIDEANRESVSVNGDILPAINRSVLHAAEILARYYEYPLMKTITLQTVQGQAYYDIPEDALASRLHQVEVIILGYFTEVKEVPYNQIAYYEAPGRAAVPSAYTIVGNRFKLTPSPSGQYQVRIWYAAKPEKLVLPAGRITAINTAQNYLVINRGPSEEQVTLTPQVDQLESYINIVDAQTGLIKGTVQILSIDDQRVNIRPVPSRSSVWGRSIVSLSQVTGIEPDDYICFIGGTCVPSVSILQHQNFITQYATAEIRRKLGDGPEMEANILDKFEDQMKRQWSGRNESTRVHKNSTFMGRRFQRYVTTRGGP